MSERRRAPARRSGTESFKVSFFAGLLGGVAGTFAALILVAITAVLVLEWFM